MTPRSRRLSLRVFIAAVGAVAVGAAVFDALVSRGHALLGPTPDIFWLMTACCVASEIRPLRWLSFEGAGEITGSWTFMMALLMVAPPLAAIGVSASLFVLTDLWARKAPIKVVFNLAQVVVSLSAGAGVLRVLGQADVLHRTGSLDLLWFPVAAAACAVAFATNTVLTCTVIALHQHLSVGTLLRHSGTANLPTDGMLLALSPIFVVVAERDLLLVLPLLITTWMVYHSAKLAVTREHEATHDQLTDLPNRRLFNDHLAGVLQSASRSGDRVGVVLLDLDGFKAINDALGHDVGDQVLGGVAERLANVCRPTDLLARLGGDEFALVLTHLESEAAAGEIAVRLLATFDQSFVTGGFPVSVKASAGVAVYPAHGVQPDLLLRRADAAMYAAKRGQCGTWVYKPDCDDASLGRLGLLADLSRALDASELFLDYQPQVDLATGEVAGVEALVRWRHPTVGVVQPAAFMPLAEQTELIGPITEWVLREALRQCARWAADGVKLRLAVNISGRNMQDLRFASTVKRLLAETRVAPSSLLVEITENTVALDRATVQAVLFELRTLGVAVAIDDFGTSYSSIVQLRDLPVDQLKLDRCFVATMARDTKNALIVRAIVQLGAALGIQTVAEGVEDQLVANMLRDLGCQQAQGYFFARPMSAQHLTGWLESLDPWQLSHLPAQSPPRIPS